MNKEQIDYIQKSIEETRDISKIDKDLSPEDYKLEARARAIATEKIIEIFSDLLTPDKKVKKRKLTEDEKIYYSHNPKPENNK